MDKLKGHIIYTINRDAKDIEELVSILKWALQKAENLQNLKNECELNGLENSQALRYVNEQVGYVDQDEEYL